MSKAGWYLRFFARENAGDDAQVEQLLALVRAAGLDLVYVKSPTELGTALEQSP